MVQVSYIDGIMTPGPQKQFDRDQVLEKAMQLFWEQGYEGTGMSQLLGHVGIGRQSLYDTFGGKHQLFLEALDHYFRTRVGPILQQLKAPGSAVDNIRGVFQMWEKMAEEGVNYGCFVGNSSAELAYTDPGMSQRLAKYFRTVEDAFYEAMKRGQQAGEISREVSARDLARTFVHVAQGLALLSRVLRDPKMVKSVMKTSMAMLKAG
jgi:TetR/AcrR family transcriptional repressor of nem operon